MDSYTSTRWSGLTVSAIRIAPAMSPVLASASTTCQIGYLDCSPLIRPKIRAASSAVRRAPVPSPAFACSRLMPAKVATFLSRCSSVNWDFRPSAMWAGRVSGSIIRADFERLVEQAEPRLAEAICSRSWVSIVARLQVRRALLSAMDRRASSRTGPAPSRLFA